MSDTKHTPGPWIRDGKFVYALMPNPKKRWPGEVNRFWLIVQKQAGYDIPEEEVEANARLIAAAPEMLEALIIIYKVWHEDSILISSVKSVIEKATGLKIEEVLNEN